MNLALWLERSAKRWPDAPALFRGTNVLSDYAGFHNASLRLAQNMRTEHKILPGDRVAVFMANRPEYLAILYAVWSAGAAVVPINYKLHPREAAWILADAEASCVFVDADIADDLGGACAETSHSPAVRPVADGFLDAIGDDPLPEMATRDANDIAWLFYTSGTTGKPKGVMMTHGNLLAMALTYLADVDDVHHSDAALYAAPMSHGAGIYNFMHVLRGARHVVPESGGFDPAEIMSLASQIGEVHMFAAPTMVSRLVAAAKVTGYVGEGIRTIVYGGGPMYLADISSALDCLGNRFVQIYGQGECPMAITALPRDVLWDRNNLHWSERAASVGMAQSCVEVAIADPDGRLLAAGETGEVIVRGTPVMAGYWKQPVATAAAIRDSWLWTGDMGSIDSEGYLTLKDRSKDVIISGGTNIYPREVEEALLAHPYISEVSVIGAADPDWGENVVAFVVGDVSREALDRHCQERIARFKRPKEYLFVSALPKNNYGKVLKTELRALYASAHHRKLDD